jgi:hypothetical protein
MPFGYYAERADTDHGLEQTSTPLDATSRRPIAIIRRSCSDSLVTASQMDRVFGSDRLTDDAMPEQDRIGLALA